LGFFSQTGERYQMTIPKAIAPAKIKAALLRLLMTEDEDNFVHQEHLVRCLKQSDVRDSKVLMAQMPR